MQDTQKLKNFPTINFVSIPESKERRKFLYEQCERYSLRICSHIYEKYKEGDLKINLGEYKNQYSYSSTYLGGFTSHFRAIRDWYENTNEPYAIFCEDDLSLETVQYWNFTWEEFFNKFPSTWGCVQLSLTRSEGEMFNYFQPEVHFRTRCWDDWSACSYLMKREHAKKLLDAYYNSDEFLFTSYKGIDEHLRPAWALRPIIETYLYTLVDNHSLFVFPLLVEGDGFDSTIWGEKKRPDYSRESILDWWKTKGKNMNVNDFFIYN